MKKLLVLLLALFFALSTAVFCVACEGGFGGNVNLGGGQDNTGDGAGDSTDDGNDDGSNGGNTDDGANDNENSDNTGDDQTETEYTDENGVTYELLTNGTYSVKSVGGSATITIPEQVNGKTVTAIGVDAFRGKKLLTTVVLPQTVKTIGTAAFKDCTKLKEINLEKVEKIGANAFENAFANTRAVLELASVVQIGSKAFLSCAKLGQVNFGQAPITEIPFQCFASGSILYTVNLSPNTTKIAERSFDACAVLTNVNLEAVQYIGFYAFQGCSSLTSIELDGIVEIGEYAFYKCDTLAKVVIGENACRIYLGAFRTLPALKHFELKTAATKDWRHYSVNYYDDRNDKLTSDGWSGENTLTDPAECASWITIQKNNFIFICTSDWSDMMGIVPGKAYPKGQPWS